MAVPKVAVKLGAPAQGGSGADDVVAIPHFIRSADELAAGARGEEQGYRHFHDAAHAGGILQAAEVGRIGKAQIEAVGLGEQHARLGIDRKPVGIDPIWGAAGEMVIRTQRKSPAESEAQPCFGIAQLALLLPQDGRLDAKIKVVARAVIRYNLPLGKSRMPGRSRGADAQDGLLVAKEAFVS
jgi:hypothetical protein